MPAFRGTMSWEEDWAMARYLRTFVPGQEVSPPFLKGGEKEPTLPNPAKVGK